MLDNAEEDILNDSLYENIAQNSAFNMDLDSLFTENQTALVRLTEKSCQHFSTIPVSIVYTGALDQQFTSGSFPCLFFLYFFFVITNLIC